MTPALLAAYAEPHRRYHTLEHVEDCLTLLRETGGLTARERRILEYAIWWHDAVYDTRRPDNEDLSAAMAERDLAAMGEPREIAAEVARLIRLTKGHTVKAGDRLGALLVSIDLSILGRAPDLYDRYAAQVREEYAWVPADAFRAGRAKVLRHFLDAVAIYPDAAFQDRYERQARANLQRELSGLG